MKSSALSLIATAGALAACLILASCGSDPPTSPGIQPQIANLADDFSYQVSSVSNFSGSASYSWHNTGIRANINQATTVASGSMTMVINDANGTQVYSRSLADNGTFVTAAGVAGAWTIRVTYNGASGTVNFRACPPPAIERFPSVISSSGAIFVGLPVSCAGFTSCFAVSLLVRLFTRTSPASLHHDLSASDFDGTSPASTTPAFSLALNGSIPALCHAAKTRANPWRPMIFSSFCHWPAPRVVGSWGDCFKCFASRAVPSAR